MGRLSRLSLGVWCEHWTPKEVSRHLFWLKERDLRLHLAVKADALASDFTPIWKEATAMGLETWAWPLLAEDQGYWPNALNAEAFSFRVRRLFEEWSSQGALPTGVSLDFEPPLQRLREDLGRLQGWGAVIKLPQFFSELMRKKQDTSVRDGALAYRALVDHLRALRLGVHAVTTPLVLADFERGTWSVRQALGLPLESDLYDWVSFMAYRSEYEKILGHVGSALARDTALRAKQCLGERSSVDIGVVGDISFPHRIEGMRDAGDLEEELTASAQAGVRRIQIYRLEGLISLGLEPTLLSGEQCGVSILPRIKVRAMNALVRWVF